MLRNKNRVIGFEKLVVKFLYSPVRSYYKINAMKRIGNYFLFTRWQQIFQDNRFIFLAQEF